MFKRYLFLIDTIKKILFSSSFYPQKDNTYELYIPYKFFKWKVHNLYSLLHTYIKSIFL